MILNISCSKDIEISYDLIRVVITSKEDKRPYSKMVEGKGIKNPYGLEYLTIVDEGIQSILLADLGILYKADLETLRNTGAEITRNLRRRGATKILLEEEIFGVISDESSKAFIEGILLGGYEFHGYKSGTREEQLDIYIRGGAKLEKLVEEAKVLVEATCISRDLVNTPANILYPETLANRVYELGEESGFSVEIHEKSDIELLGMKAFLSVARGSGKLPKFIVMRYNGDPDSNKTLGFVGKGITYDSGGYSLKRAQSMVDMKNDMGGAASVIGAMCAIAKSKVKKNIVAVIAACENLVSQDSYKPGDVIETMAGKSVEVLNTDCEGRLTLADALHYIVENEGVDEVVTIATLTGGAMNMFGEVATPGITNNDKFYGKLEASSALAGEKIWRMPAYPEFREMNFGEIADLKNASGKAGGFITAGLFVGEFTKGLPWCHLDIAGTVMSSETKGYRAKGASGVGAKTLFYLAKQ